MPVIRTADAETMEIHGTRFISYARPALGSKELCGWRGEIPAGVSSPVHTVTREELFHLLSGEVEITLDGHTEPLAPGDTAVINAGVPVQIHNRTAETAVAWVTTSVGMAADLADGTHLTPPWAN
ncbi:cupin domain-containing protein [Streptomyces sp. NPDC002577]